MLAVGVVGVVVVVGVPDAHKCTHAQIIRSARRRALTKNHSHSSLSLTRSNNTFTHTHAHILHYVHNYILIKYTCCGGWRLRRRRRRTPPFPFASSTTSTPVDASPTSPPSSCDNDNDDDSDRMRVDRLRIFHLATHPHEYPPAVCGRELYSPLVHSNRSHPASSSPTALSAGAPF